jgi:hypothetical protein
VGEVIQKQVGMEVVAKITIGFNEQDPGFGVLHAQVPKTIPLHCEMKAWEQATCNQVSSLFSLPGEAA